MNTPYKTIYANILNEKLKKQVEKKLKEFEFRSGRDGYSVFYTKEGMEENRCPILQNFGWKYIKIDSKEWKNVRVLS